MRQEEGECFNNVNIHDDDKTCRNKVKSPLSEKGFTQTN